jgi:glycosyltransferase involved in cell wall biosynthesis
VRALLDATALGTGRGGDETLLRSVLGGIASVSADADHHTVLIDPVLCGGSDLASAGIGVGANGEMSVELMTRAPGARHFGADLPRYLAKRRSEFDVVLTLTHAPIWSPIPSAVTVTDLSFLRVPDLYPHRTRWRLGSLIGYHVRRAAVVLTPSEFCRNDLLEHYRLEPERVHVVPLWVGRPGALAWNSRDRAMAVLERFGVSPPFLLYLGNLHPRKNVSRTIAAFAQAKRSDPAFGEHRFVVAGGRWWGSGEAEAATSAPEGSVVFLGRVDEDVRRLLLEQADALVYASLFEGFGLPPLEAMAVGTPVLAGDAAAVPEVTGGAALLVDPRDESAIGEGMRRIVTDEHLRAELVRRGTHRVSHYHPRRTGQAARAALRAASGLAPRHS